MSQRINRILTAMADNQEEAFLVTEPKNRRYLSGFTGSAGWLVISPEKRFLITDSRYWDQVAEQAPDFQLFRYRPQVHKNLTGAFRCLLEEETIAPEPSSIVSLEIDDMPVVLYRTLVDMLTSRSLTVEDSEGRVKAHRTIKDQDELALLKRAAEIADLALSVALSGFEIGMTEADLRTEIDYQVLRHGGEGASFPTIVASGKSGSFPHAGASRKPIQKGELVTIDFGAIWQGYCSDMTRTVWWGQLSSDDRRLISEVRRAQAKAVAAAKPGIAAGDLDQLARNSLESAGLAEYFVHSLGHGVGLDVHEAPSLRAGQTDLLLAGQVVTIEPGVYITGRTGCRVEDTVVLKDGGCEVLNGYPKQELDASAPPILRASQ